ncbi:MAG TPA: hypothetical protein P5305_03945 [Rubrivivax sp.]|nr:hypothetical protein [Rubrivivax sp.]HRY87014.1 hypothetical protein [Rubrivivax sp.]
MNDRQDRATLFNPDSQQLLDDREMYLEGDIVRDCDGRALFLVPLDISRQSLATILLWGERCYSDGERLGRHTLKGQLLGLIGAQPAVEPA